MAQITIPCTKCDYNNEPQRIYCHNCGEKLDRSKVIELQEQAAQKIATQQPKAQPAKPVKPVLQAKEAEAHGGKWIKSLFRTAVYAALAAALILAALPPAATPPAPASTPQKPETARLTVESVLMGSQGSSATLSPEAVNDFLYVYGKVTTHPNALIQPKRTFALLDNGSIQVNLENSIKGVPFYVGATFRVANETSPVEVALHKINIGRLNLPPVAMPLIRNFITPLLDGLEREHQLIRKLGKFVITKEGITVTSRLDRKP